MKKESNGNSEFFEELTQDLKSKLQELKSPSIEEQASSDTEQIFGSYEEPETEFERALSAEAPDEAIPSEEELGTDGEGEIATHQRESSENLPQNSSDRRGQDGGSGEIREELLKKLEEEEFKPFEMETEITLDDGTKLLFERVISPGKGRAEWEGQLITDSQSRPVQLIELSPTRYKWAELDFVDLEDGLVLKPELKLDLSEKYGKFVLVYPWPRGYRLTDKIRDPNQFWNLDQLEDFLRKVVKKLAPIHREGYVVFLLDEYHLWIDHRGEPVLVGVEQFYTEGVSPYLLPPTFEGYTPPEFLSEGKIGKFSDVFSLAATLFYMITKAQPFNHLHFPNPTIPTPRVFEKEFPIGLDPVILKALAPNYRERYSDIERFFSDFQTAYRDVKERRAIDRKALKFSFGYDIHIGVNKGLRNPVNQDALFWRYDPQSGKGIFLIADGVTHCSYGSGDLASSILVESTKKHWQLLKGDEKFLKTPTTRQQRQKIIQSILDSANSAIADYVNEYYEKVDGYVEDVMGTTCVLAFLDANQLTLANLGDSRAYLKTETYIAQITIDHDYLTAQLQTGCDFQTAYSMKMTNLITKCVGACEKDDNLKVYPQHLQPDFFDINLKGGDSVLMCSDGLSDYIGRGDREVLENIDKVLSTISDPMRACYYLVELANENGGGDNISVILLKVIE